MQFQGQTDALLEDLTKKIDELLTRVAAMEQKLDKIDRQLYAQS
jgi:hypothetical protein